MAVQQSTVNFAQNNKFKFTLTEIPNVVFFGVEFTTPELSTQSIKLDYKQHYINVGSDKLEYGSLTVTFKIDENYQNYIEIVKWLEGIGKPHSYDERIELVQSRMTTKYQKGEHLIYSDASLFALDNDSNPNIEIIFKDIFPISLTGINLTSKVSNDQPLEATATFAIQSMEFKPVIK